MQRLRINTPIWLARDSAHRRVRFPTLTADLDVDIAIVGGGITGAALAWRFADAGIRVALVEAKLIGRGSTAASTALLMQEPDEDLANLTTRYGRSRAHRIWQLSLAATRDLVATLTRLRIASDLTRRDSVYYAVDERDARSLRIEHRRRTVAGLGGQWLDRAELRPLLRFDAAGGIRTSGNAQVDPFKACVGLMRAAGRAGARVFERSPVESIRSSRHDIVVTTRRGRIRAERVVIATGYATPYFKPLLGRFRMLNTFVVATRPLTPSERRRVGPGPVMIWDTERPYHYARWTRDHRLIIGGRDRPMVSGAVARRRALDAGTRTVHADFVRLYPELAGIDIDYRWAGLFATTPDRLPYIGPHRRYPRHLFALGYGGNGMTFGFLASKLLLDWYRGDRHADHALFAFSR